MATTLKPLLESDIALATQILEERAETLDRRIFDLQFFRIKYIVEKLHKIGNGRDVNLLPTELDIIVDSFEWKFERIVPGGMMDERIKFCWKKFKEYKNGKPFMHVDVYNPLYSRRQLKQETSTAK